jgi:pyruvate dehydrogenase E1 component alpha subunit
VAVAFFGDGATNTGTFHESLNLAQLWKTKTLFVCENNSWAESTPGWQHSPVWEDMSKRALAYDMYSIKVDGQDVEEVYEKATEALDYVRSGRGPVFLDVETYRMHGHYIGDPQVYRSQEDRERAAAHDPIVLLRERLHASEDEWNALEEEVTGIVEAAVEFAKAGTDPQPEDALKNIYA